MDRRICLEYRLVVVVTLESMAVQELAIMAAMLVMLIEHRGDVQSFVVS